MEDDRIPKQAMYWQMGHHVKRKPERPRKNRIDTICQDLKTIGMAWEEAEASAANSEDWRRSVAQCVYDRGDVNLSLSNFDGKSSNNSGANGLRHQNFIGSLSHKIS